MNRQLITPRSYLLRGAVQVDALIALLPHLPLDDKNPIEVLVREEPKKRTLSQNSLMWVGPLKDMEEQGFHDGKQFSADMWHYLFKVMYLPEDGDPELSQLTRDGYKKWDYAPNGDRLLVGSTTELTKKGFSQYIEQLYAHGASMGVMFRSSPGEMGGSL